MSVLQGALPGRRVEENEEVGNAIGCCGNQYHYHDVLKKKTLKDKVLNIFKIVFTCPVLQ